MKAFDWNRRNPEQWHAEWDAEMSKWKKQDIIDELWRALKETAHHKRALVAAQSDLSEENEIYGFAQMAESNGLKPGLLLALEAARATATQNFGAHSGEAHAIEQLINTL